MNQRFSIALLTTAIGLTAAVYLGLQYFFPSDRTYSIAYIGRYTNAADTVPIARQERNRFELLHETVMRDYLERLSDSLGDIRLVLKTFDNRRDPRVSDSLYRMIASDTSVLMIVDNTWGEHLIPSAPIIRENALPVISMNADRADADFGPTVLFTGNDDDVPGQMAAYLRGALGVDRVALISEEDYALHTTYLSALAHDSIAVDTLFSFRRTAGATIALDSLITQTIAYYRSRPDALSIPLLMNVHNVAGDRIIRALDSALDGITMIGGAYISSIAAAKRFGLHPANRIIVMGRPTDAVSRETALDFAAYQARQPGLFDSPSAPYFIERCETATAIIASIVAHPDVRRAPKRSLAAAHLSTLHGSMVAGRGRLYEVDRWGNLIEEVYFTKYQGGSAHSMPHQINRARQPIPNLFLGLDITSIHDLDVNASKFNADFFYWIKVDTAHRSAEQNLLFTNLVEGESARQLVIEKVDGEVLYKLYKVSGVFQQQYQLRDYPLDQQELAIRLEFLSPADDLRISFDQKSIEADPAMLDRFNVPAWSKQRYFVTVDNRVATSMRGDPTRDEDKPAIFKTISFRLQVARKLLDPLLEIILPLFLIGFVAIATLYVKDISFDNLGQVSVGTFLGIITFSIALASITPTSDYLTKANLLFWLSFFVVLISFMTIIIINARYRISQLEGISIRPLAIAMSILFPIAVVAIMYL